MMKDDVSMIQACVYNQASSFT